MSATAGRPLLSDSVHSMLGDLDRESVTPLYKQLAAILRERVTSGIYAGRMPSEWDFAEEFDVSRDTVRKAAKVLVGEGLVGISKGRGMFALPPGDE